MRADKCRWIPVFFDQREQVRHSDRSMIAYCKLLLTPGISPTPSGCPRLMSLAQVKNMFVCAPAQKGVSRFSSVWEVVRSLDDLFPGQSEFIRADLMMLVVLNGNDYLPKLRGVSFRRCFRSYVKLKESKFR